MAFWCLSWNLYMFCHLSSIKYQVSLTSLLKVDHVVKMIVGSTLLCLLLCAIISSGGAVTWNRSCGSPKQITTDLIYWCQTYSNNPFPTQPRLLNPFLLGLPMISLLFWLSFFASLQPPAATHFFDSVISILLYHHAVYHLIYSASLPCSKTQQLLSVLIKDKTNTEKTPKLMRTWFYVCIYIFINIYIRISWHRCSGDESFDCCSSLKAIKFRISLALRGQQGKVNLLLKSRGSWRKFPQLLISMYTLHPHQT